jgi:hypothetical protein
MAMLAGNVLAEAAIPVTSSHGSATELEEETLKLPLLLLLNEYDTSLLETLSDTTV